ncbi:AAA family ATPase [Streptomyces rubiginosohelvolus]|uniref:AAA family ATPase n=1 Tax=Streptomyces rubiginosohelvolus TaxID=67362 RepID=UPI00379C413A
MLYVITGPPAAGKSTWITARAKPTDIVIDLDRITQALTGPGAPAWSQEPIALKVAHRARYAAIDEAVKHLDATDVYLIHTMPTPKWRARYRRYGAEIIAVDPGREIVMQRITEMRAPGLQAVATRWYAQQAKRPRDVTTTHQPSRAW